MKIKIEIKNRWTGSIMFEYESEENTILQTLKEAVKSGADLRGAYLRGADLRGAYLRGADLRGADLRGADLSGADINGADLRGADLRGAYLNGEKIKTAIVFTGLYKYIVIPFITEKDVKMIKMGCYTRTLEEWSNDFWNNPNEFPNNGDMDSKLRLIAFETAKKWFEVIETK